MGPIASLVRRHILLQILGELWFWQLKGYSARHAAIVERDAAVMEHWRAISEALGLLFRDREDARLWMTRLQPRLGARPIDLAVDGGFEGLLAVSRHLNW